MNELPKQMRGDIPCMDCGTENNPVWFIESIFWNKVMKDVKGSGILCPQCFIKRAEKKFRTTGWKISPEFN